MHQLAQVAPVAFSDRAARNPCRARPGLLRRRTSTALAALVVSLGLVVPAALFGPASLAAAYPSSTVVISGHGYGHGIGMGQWGSLGYAIGADNGAGNDTYQQILAHYYGNTDADEHERQHRHARRQRHRGHDGGRRHRHHRQRLERERELRLGFCSRRAVPSGRHRALPDRDGARLRRTMVGRRLTRLEAGGVTTAGCAARPVHAQRDHRGPRDAAGRHRTRPARPARSTSSRSSSTWPTWRPPSRRRAGRSSAARGREGWPGASSRARRRRWRPVRTSSRTPLATAATPTPATRRASPTRA